MLLVLPLGQLAAARSSRLSTSDQMLMVTDAIVFDH
jgi:hypothetical protein